MTAVHPVHLLTSALCTRCGDESTEVYVRGERAWCGWCWRELQDADRDTRNGDDPNYDKHH